MVIPLVVNLHRFHYIESLWSVLITIGLSISITIPNVLQEGWFFFFFNDTECLFTQCKQTWWNSECQNGSPRCISQLYTFFIVFPYFCAYLVYVCVFLINALIVKLFVRYTDVLDIICVLFLFLFKLFWNVFFFFKYLLKRELLNSNNKIKLYNFFSQYF